SKLSVGPVLALSSSTLTYTPEPIGVTSPAQTLTITSVGDTNLNIATVTKSGDFAISSDTCLGTSVPPGASCQVGVTFTPTAPGTRGGTLTITDNAADSPQTVNLTGLVTFVFPTPAEL